MKSNLQSKSGQINQSLLLTKEEKDKILPFLRNFVKGFNEDQKPLRDLTIESYPVEEKSKEYIISICLIGAKKEERDMFLGVLIRAINDDYSEYSASYDIRITSIKIQRTSTIKLN